MNRIQFGVAIVRTILLNILDTLSLFPVKDMPRYCFALDLKNDSELISQYKAWHKPDSVPAAVSRSFVRAGIGSLEIYCVGNRLFMVIEADADFNLNAETGSDSDAIEIQAWEALMDHFQQPLPGAHEGEKWMAAETIYRFEANDAVTC
jgi:L-rhamnose mutarotase